MAIKLKNKLAFVIWVLLFTYGVSGILVSLSHGGIYNEKNYYYTQSFQLKFSDYVEFLQKLELPGMDSEAVKKQLRVSQEEIDDYRKRDNLTAQVKKIHEQYEQKIQEALAANNQQLADTLTQERDKKIVETTQTLESDENIRKLILQEKEERVDQYFQKQESLYLSRLNDYENTFIYYFKRKDTGEYFSNVVDFEKKSIKTLFNKKETAYLQPILIPFDDSFYSERSPDYDELVTPIIKNHPIEYEGEIAILKAPADTNFILEEAKRYQDNYKFFMIYSTSSVIIFFLCLFFYKKIAGNLLGLDGRLRKLYNLIPIDLRFLSIIVLLFGIFVALDGIIKTFNIDGWPIPVDDFLIFWMILALFTAITLILGVLLFQSFKDREKLTAEWKRAVVYILIKAIWEDFIKQSSGMKFILLMALCFLSGVGAFMSFLTPGLLIVYIPFLLLVGLPTFSYFVKQLRYFNQITKTAGELARGVEQKELPIFGKSELAGLAENLNKLKRGVETSQREQAKSERLKTELITNVSHDLRTPLTTIITYTELLKAPGVTDGDRQAYIQIIDRKSKRLKVLIDDLFEASKMASGNIELTKEKVDLVQLLHQSLAEYNEAIEKSTLQFRVANPPDTQIFAVVDGQKIWRVFENLIGNIMKYSQDNTRVFIGIKALNNGAEITFKNVTKYELSENVDELFERFKRGDKSRNTEGSGLGLAIAKSIIDLHGGTMDIEIDGDLFKVTITL